MYEEDEIVDTNVILAYHKSFTEDEVRVFFTELNALNPTGYFEASSFEGFNYQVNEGTLVVYATDIEGDWKYTHRYLNAFFVLFAMLKGYDVDVHQTDYYNDNATNYGCTHVFVLHHSLHKVGVCLCEEFASFNDTENLIAELNRLLA